MNSQNDKEGSGHVKAAFITGRFALLAACVAGFFLVLNTMVNNGVWSNPSVPPTVNQYQAPTNEPTAFVQTVFASTSQPLPTLTGLPSFVPVPNCPSVISRQTIEQWAQADEVSKSKAQEYIDNFDRMRSSGEYKIGAVLPSGVAIVTDFGNGESDIYLTLPVRAIAHYHSWGVFEVLSEYTAIQTGACMTIMP